MTKSPFEQALDFVHKYEKALKAAPLYAQPHHVLLVELEPVFAALQTLLAANEALETQYKQTEGLLLALQRRYENTVTQLNVFLKESE